MLPPASGKVRDRNMDVMIEVVGESLRVSAVDDDQITMLASIRLAPSDSDRRRFFARLHERAAELGVDANALAQAIADIRERLGAVDPQSAVRSIHTKR
jgi:hypothetical protein